MALASVALAFGFCVALHISTELTVFGRVGLLNFSLPIPVLLIDAPRLFVWFVPVALFSSVVLQVSRKGKWAAVLLLLLVPFFLVVHTRQIEKRQKDMSASCGNHSNFWRFSASRAGDFAEPLPNTIEFEDYLAYITEEDVHKHLGSLTCPGYALSGTKTGVAYVGGGLKLKPSTKHPVLIAFCDWRCHPPPYDHLHCLYWHFDHLERDCSNNKKIIEMIEQALAAAQSGEVSYSAAAVAVLKAQLEQRKAYSK